MNAAAARRASALVADPVSQGAELAAGTGDIEEPGTLIRPVVLTGVTKEMKVYYDEIFGPATVAHVIDSADQALALANDTHYGLTAGAITENLAKGLKVASRLRTGIVHVNDQSIAAGAEAFTDTRWVTAQAVGHAPSRRHFDVWASWRAPERTSSQLWGWTVTDTVRDGSPEQRLPDSRMNEQVPGSARGIRP